MKSLKEFRSMELSSSETLNIAGGYFPTPTMAAYIFSVVGGHYLREGGKWLLGALAGMDDGIEEGLED